MQSHPEVDDDLAARGPLGVQLGDALPHREGRLRGRDGAIRRIAHRAKRRHEAVARELVEDAAGVEDAARHRAKICVHRGDRLLRREALGEGGGSAKVREQDRHRLPLALETQRIALNDALHDRRRQESLETAPSIEFQDERADRENDRPEHQAVVFPPRRRPDRPEEL